MSKLYLFSCHFLIFLIACLRIFRIGHLQVACCDKGGDVTLSFFCLIR